MGLWSDIGKFANTAKNYIDSQITKSGHDFGKFIGKYIDPTGTTALNQQKDANLELQHDAQEFNSAEAQKERNWQERMSNTAFTRQMADIQNAGYNPYLALGGGNGAATGSVSPASSSALSVSRPDNKGLQIVGMAMNGLGNMLKTGSANSAATIGNIIKIIGVAAMAAAA